MKKSQPPSERHYCHGALLELTCTYVSDTRIVSTIPKWIVILAFYSLVKVKARSASAVQLEVDTISEKNSQSREFFCRRYIGIVQEFFVSFEAASIGGLFSFDGSRSYPVTIS